MQDFLALRNDRLVFALPLKQVERVLRWNGSKGTRHGESHTTIVGQRAVSVLDVDRLSANQRADAPSERRLVLVNANGDYGLVVDEALNVFGCGPDELRSQPTEQDVDELVIGFCPWSKLATYLIHGAIGANQLAMSLIAARGSLEERDDKLYAGSSLLEGDRQIVDEVQQQTGYGCTIFKQDVRIATTAVSGGSQVRAIGTRASRSVTSTTLLGGRDFRGIVRTVGRDWAIMYRPLRATDRRILGMVATYSEVSTRIFPAFDIEALLQRLSKPTVEPLSSAVIQ